MDKLHNQQRFVNYTRDAVEGLAKQLDRTSIMTWRIMQHQMALDMLLDEKGGVCKVFVLGPYALRLLLTTLHQMAQ